MKLGHEKLLGLIGMGLLIALAPACGDDDDDNGSNNTSGSAGKGGSSSTSAGNGGKAGSGGKPNGGSNQGLGGADGGVAGEDGVAGEGGAGGAPTTARLRVIHASPSAPEVDVYPAGSADVAVAGVAYGEATAFLEVPAGEIAFDLRAAGADAADEPAFTSPTLELEAGAEYTVVAAGEFGSTDEDTTFRLLPLEHDFTAPNGTSSFARVVHATPAWANVDIDITATDGVDLPGVAAFESESNVEVPDATPLALTVGTEADGVLSKLSLPAIDAGGELFVIATGNPGQPFRAPANGFALLVVDQDGNVSWVKEDPWLHLLNVSDVGTVDIYNSAQTAAAAKLADDVAAETLAGFQLPASQTGYTLKAVAGTATSGTASGLATLATSSLAAGEHYLAYIAGTTMVKVQEQFDLTQPTKVVLRGVHASVSVAQTIDFGPVSGTALASALISGVAPALSSAAAGVAIEPGDATMGVATTATTTPLLAQKAFTGDAAFTAGERGFVLLAGSGALWFVDTSVAGWAVR